MSFVSSGIPIAHDISCLVCMGNLNSPWSIAMQSKYAYNINERLNENTNQNQDSSIMSPRLKNSFVTRDTFNRALKICKLSILLGQSIFDRYLISNWLSQGLSMPKKVALKIVISNYSAQCLYVNSRSVLAADSGARLMSAPISNAINYLGSY